jgi:hypothetical protein
VCYCSKRYCSDCFSVARCGALFALFTVQSALPNAGADSLSHNKAPHHKSTMDGERACNARIHMYIYIRS